MPSPVNPAILQRNAGVKTQKSNRQTDQKAMQKACEEFESLLVHQMLKQMRQTVPKTGLLDGGNAEQMYRSMLDGELSRQISQRKGIGLAPMIYRQIKSLADQKQITRGEDLKSDPEVPID